VRISATLLDSFLFYLGAESSHDDEKASAQECYCADCAEGELIRHIKGEFSPTPAILLGRAYHSIVEKPQRSLSGFYEADGFRFEDAAVETLLQRIPLGIFEVKTTRELLVPRAGVVTLVAKCDHISGASISDFKATLKAFDSEKYLASVQWRVYLFLFQASKFTYHVACLREERDHDYQQQVPRYALRSLESMNVYPYPDLERDVRELLKEFCGYVKARGLTEYLIPKAEKAEAR
jgi:hypothetical protein